MIQWKNFPENWFNGKIFETSSSKQTIEWPFAKNEKLTFIRSTYEWNERKKEFYWRVTYCNEIRFYEFAAMCLYCQAEETTFENSRLFA